MARTRARPRAVRPPPVPPPGRRRMDLLLGALAAAAACIVYWGALRYFFAQDDFTGLARARGLMPRLHAPWRWISGQLYFDLMGRIAGLDPLPYRIASLAAHAGCVALVYALCR